MASGFPIDDYDSLIATTDVELLKRAWRKLLRFYSFRPLWSRDPAPPSSILKPDASGQRWVGNLLSKGRSRTIDSCSLLREARSENPMELHPEILDWFQQGFHDRFEELWAQMHCEVLLEPQQQFPKRVKREKRKK